MRKTFLVLLAGLLLAGCAGKAPKNGALIQGEAAGYDPEETVVALLFQYDGVIGAEIMQDTLQNGQFSFQLDSLPETCDHYSVDFLRTSGGRMKLDSGPEIYLEPGAVVRIQGEGKYFKYARIDSPVKDQRLRERIIRRLSEADWRASKDEATRQEAIDRLRQQELKLLETEEIGRYALSEISFFARDVSNGEEEIRENVERLYGRLSDEQKASYLGMRTINYLQPVQTLGVGSPVPDYDYIDKEGDTVHLSDFKGKWILMDFWSHGCGPCVKAIPELGELSRAFQQELAVVSINLDKESIWKPVSKRHGIFWNDWNDPKGTAGSFRSYGSEAIPVFVLVSPDGIIQRIKVGYARGWLRDMVEEVLK